MNRIVALIVAAPLCTMGQLRPDPQILAAIAKIKAIDNHAHPVRWVAQGDRDTDFDALPVDTMEPYSEPVRTRPESGTVVAAWRALFGVSTAAEAAARKKEIMARQKDRYPAWVLDRLGVDTMLANRVKMGSSIGPPRFVWVPFADAFMYPLNNSHLASRAPDYKELFADEERLLARYLKASGYTSVPKSFEEYLSKFVTGTLEQQKAGGAVAVKFEAAYLRALDFGDPSRDEAERVFKIESPSDSDYKLLQDYIFRHIARECGRLGMAVHLHVQGGAGGYFNVAGANPMNLEPLLNDAGLRKTNFVFIHGGWPFTREMTALLSKPNAYLDFSQMTFTNYPRNAAEAIRGWLEWAPEKVMFATDAYPFSAEMGWEEAGWIGADTGRTALALALTGMLNDNEISRTRALEIARLVMRDNARKLYRLRE